MVPPSKYPPRQNETTTQEKTQQKPPLSPGWAGIQKPCAFKCAPKISQFRLQHMQQSLSSSSLHSCEEPVETFKPSFPRCLFKLLSCPIQLVMMRCKGACPYVIMCHSLVCAGFAAPRAQPSKASTASQSEAAIEVNEGLTASLAFQGQNVLNHMPPKKLNPLSGSVSSCAG